ARGGREEAAPASSLPPRAPRSRLRRRRRDDSRRCARVAPRARRDNPRGPRPPGLQTSCSRVCFRYVQGDDTPGEEPVANAGEPGALQQYSEIVGAREAAHARRQIRVRRTARRPLPERRPEAADPAAVDRRETPARRRDLRDAEPPAW